MAEPLTKTERAYRIERLERIKLTMAEQRWEVTCQALEAERDELERLVEANEGRVKEIVDEHLRRENERLGAEVARLQEEADNVRTIDRAETKRLRTALEIYSSRDHWFNFEVHTRDHCFDDWQWAGPFCITPWRSAEEGLDPQAVCAP